MSKYQIVMPHDAAQCMEALEEVMSHDPELHSQVLYGCPFGDCTGYAVVEASSLEEARSKVPETLRRRAKVVEVTHIDPAVIISSHDKAL